MRLILAIIAMLVLAQAAGAQQRARMNTQSAETGSGTESCQIQRIAISRGGAALLCGSRLYAFDGGTAPGGISAFMSWALDARSRQASARDTITIEFEPANNVHQAICAAVNMPGPTNRQPLTCRAIRAAYR